MMFGIDALAPTASPPRLRSQLLRGFRFALVVITAAWLAAPTTARAQTDYVLSNASAVLNGMSVSISRVFATGNGGLWFANSQ
jgi:hypothetical protein